MTSDWKYAPDWATHLAGDSSGEHYWFEGKPVKCFRLQGWRETNEREPELAFVERSNFDWEASLQERPDHIPSASKMMEKSDERKG